MLNPDLFEGITPLFPQLQSQCNLFEVLAEKLGKTLKETENLISAIDSRIAREMPMLNLMESRYNHWLDATNI